MRFAGVPDLGLGVVHLGFLAAAAAVAVPLAIHLLFRQRPRRVDLGTLQFLRVAVRERAGSRRLRHWILLLLRTAGVLLIAVLFARPYWSARGALSDDREIVLLIDRSASMGADGPGASPFDRATREAGERLASLPSQTSVRLAYFDADAVLATEGGKTDPAMRPGLGRTDYTKALNWARDIVVGSRRRAREVVLWTDLQRNGLGTPSTEPFPPGVAVQVVDVGRTLTRNLAVEELQAEQTDLRKGKPVAVAARLFNAGLFPAQGVRVRLVIEGLPAIEQTVSIDQRARRLVRFEVPIREPGLYRGHVEVAAGDDLPFDDRRWLAFEARRPDRFLLVDGEPGHSVFGNETYFLEMGLRLALPGDEPSASTTPYVPERFAWKERGALPDVSPYRVVALCNVPALSAADVAVLERFVSSGGCLLIFTGDHVEARAGDALQTAKFVPGVCKGAATDGPNRFAEWKKDHPIFLPFADPLHGDLRSLRFRKIARIEPAPDAVVLATARDGLPLVMEKPFGAGKSLLFAFPADNAWGEWAIHRLFLPLVHQLAGYATNRLPELSAVKPAQTGQAGNDVPGVVVDRGHALVRNVDATESQLDRTTVAQIRERYRLPEPGDQPRRTELAAVHAAGSERPDEFWRPIAWALLVVMVVEVFLANKTYA